MQLQSIVPFGRSFDDYRRMFALTDSDLSGRILGCGDGPAGFNADATRQGAQVISCDPLYAHTRAAIATRIAEVLPEMRRQVELHRDEFVWDRHADVDALMAARSAAMQVFLNDYDAGRAVGRYRDAALPMLPFADRQFNLALVSHLLFLYSDHLDQDFHRRSLLELLRVADEVRVFPLQTLTGEKSPFLAPLRQQLGFLGIPSALRQVPYESQRGANQMLILRKPARPRHITPTKPLPAVGAEAVAVPAVSAVSATPPQQARI